MYVERGGVHHEGDPGAERVVSARGEEGFIALLRHRGPGGRGPDVPVLAAMVTLTYLNLCMHVCIYVRMYLYMTLSWKYMYVISIYM